MTTGEVIKTLRCKRNITQEQLGKILGVKKSAIQKYENGGINNLKIDIIRRICVYFDIQPWLLIFPEKVEARDLDRTMTSIYSQAAKLNVDGRIRLSEYISDILLIDKYLNEQNVRQTKKNKNPNTLLNEE